jgi:hypothetical protein
MAVHERPRGSSGRRRMITVFNSRLNVEDLGDIADSVRASLRARNGLGSKGEELMKVLGTAVKSECDGVPIIDLETLKQARLDKLLADMVNKDYHEEDMPLELRAHLSVAESLQRQWRMRFRGSYFSIDHTRYLYLTEIGGRLHNLIFNHASKDNSGLWKAKKCGSLSRLERNDRFKEGR